jgi:hypothetical protein
MRELKKSPTLSIPELTLSIPLLTSETVPSTALVAESTAETAPTFFFFVVSEVVSEVFSDVCGGGGVVVVVDFFSPAQEARKRRDAAKRNGIDNEKIFRKLPENPKSKYENDVSLKRKDRNLKVIEITPFSFVGSES